MKVLFVVASLNPEWGGPVQVIKHTSEHLAEKGIDITIYSPANEREKDRLIIPKGVKVKLFTRSFFSFIWTGFSFSLIKDLKKKIQSFDIVHIHEIWHFPQFLAAKLSVKYKIPYVITVHGALNHYALNIKSFKKRVFGMFFEKKIIEQAAGIQAIMKSEVISIKEYLPGSKVKLIFNGITEEKNIPEQGSKELFKLYPQLASDRVILFMGRLDRIKGLDILVESFHEISKKFDDLQLIIAGPDFGYKKKLKKLIKKVEAEDRIILTGNVAGEIKNELFNISNIFVLPSYSEAFSIAVLEAIINRLPVIVSHNCNFPEIEEIGAGKLIDPDCSSLIDALNNMLTDENYMRFNNERGRNFVLENYSWNRIVLSLINWYKLIKG